MSKLAAWALWIAAWQAASLILGNAVLLAGPVETCASLVRIISGPQLLPALGFSFARVAAGFLASFVVGVGLGFVAHRWPVVRALAEPAVLACKSVPVACVTVLLLIWVGSRQVSGIAVFLMAFPALYLATLEGLAHLDEQVGQMLDVFGVHGVRRLCAHTWPGVLPFLVATSKNACGMAWKAGVAAELIGTPVGSLGERIYQAKILLETADLFAWTILVVAVSYACERAFVALLAATGPLALRLSVPRGGGERTAVAPASVELTDAALGYGDVVVLPRVSLRVPAGGHALLDGASGTGKTTFLHTAMGLIPARGGCVVAPAQLSVVFQEARLVNGLSAEDNALLVGAGGRTRAEVSDLLRELLPVEALGRPVGELSGGQRRRVELVRALAHPSAAVLLDEPFASLDEGAHQAAAAFVLRHLDGRTLIVASHLPGDAELLAARPLPLAR